MKKLSQVCTPILLFVFATVAANAQSFRVQCPTSTITHPDPLSAGINSSEPAYNGPTQVPFMTIANISESATTVTVTATAGGAFPGLVKGLNIAIVNVSPSGFNGIFPITSVASTETAGITTATFTYTASTSGLGTGTGGVITSNANGAIKCQQISGGDGLMTEADGNQTFMFSFGPLSGLADIAAGLPSTQFPNVFNAPWPGCTSEPTPTNPNTCPTPLVRGDPATTDGATTGASPGTALPELTAKFTWNGAVGLIPDIATLVTVTDLIEGPINATTAPGATAPGCPTATASSTTVTGWTDAPLNLQVGQQAVIANGIGDDGTPTPAGYAGTWTITCVTSSTGMSPDGISDYAFQYVDTTAGLASDTGNDEAATASSVPTIDGHVDPRQIMDVGVMNGNIPAPLAAFDEDDEFFLTLTNVGMIMRPDLFEQHTVHFHGYPNASSFYDGVPDASIAINIGASFTYYYLAPDAGTYFWHCHITPPEHLQMGMVGQLHVRPRQDRVPSGGNLYTYLGYQNGIGLPTGTFGDLRTECNPGRDILCSATMPSVPNTVTTARSATIPTSGVQGLDLLGNPQRYVYNDGDGSTAYDVQYPLQMHGFDPNFHFVGMTFNPEMFVDMKDKYFLLNGRSYPDTVGLCGTGGGGGTGGSSASGYPLSCVAGPQATVATDGQMHYSQPLPAIINIPVGGKALLRMVNLSVTEYHTLQSVGIPMKEVGFMAKLLRDQAGNNTEFYTNSITLGGGESLDVILDASDDSCSAYAGGGCSAKLYPAGSTFYLYTPQLDHLSNDAENFGGMMTEVHICNSVTGPAPNPKSQYPNPPGSTFGNTCN